MITINISLTRSFPRNYQHNSIYLMDHLIILKQLIGVLLTSYLAPKSNNWFILKNSLFIFNYWHIVFLNKGAVLLCCFVSILRGTIIFKILIIVHNEIGYVRHYLNCLLEYSKDYFATKISSLLIKKNTLIKCSIF